jgi:hypothetical protein
MGYSVESSAMRFFALTRAASGVAKEGWTHLVSSGLLLFRQMRKGKVGAFRSLSFRAVR